MIYRLARFWFRLLFKLYFQWEVTGGSHLPARGPAILVCNHVSFVDPPLLGSGVSRIVHFMTKEELFGIPVLGWLLPRVHAFPVRRGRPDRQALGWALRVLEQGGVVGVFPEGTRSRTGELQPPFGGAAWLALHARVPVVPAALVYHEEVLPVAGRLPRRGRVELRLGPPLDFGHGGRVTRERVDEVSREILGAIAGLLAPAASGAGKAGPAGGGGA